jgi:hypothetical protein
MRREALKPTARCAALLDGLYDGCAGWRRCSWWACWHGAAVHHQPAAHFHVPGTDAYAGYLMAAAGFLALAHTLKRGEHIRVTLLVINALTALAHRRWSCGRWARPTLLALLFAFYSCRLAWQSHQFNDISTGNDATPLWIPQLAWRRARCWPSPSSTSWCSRGAAGASPPTSGEALRNE